MPSREGTADLVAGLSPQRRRVFDALSAEARPVSAVAEILGLHVNTAREHLDGLVESGLVHRSRLAPKGRGRPGWGYAVRVGASSPAIGEYAALAGVLADHVAAQGGDVSGNMRELGRGWGAALVGSRKGSPAEPTQAAGSATGPAEGDAQHTRAQAETEVIRLLADLGFDPEQGPRSTRLRQCPMLAVAREHPEVVCSVHQGLVEGAMEASGASADGVELEAFAEVGACRLTLH
jgi:predicted ArsR family transcriptional regulator